MASQAEASELSTMFERLVRNRDLSLFLPFIFGFANSIPRANPQDPDEENENRATSRDRVILINPFTQGMVVIDGFSSLDSVLRDLGGKDGQPPASKASIEAMPGVEIEEEGLECVICLEEFEVGGVAKEMPCKHKFHRDCIEKWLGIHGSCPVCRHSMPVDEEEMGKKREEEGRERRRGEVWVSFSFNSGRRSEEANQVSSADSDVNDSNSGPEADREVRVLKPGNLSRIKAVATGFAPGDSGEVEPPTTLSLHEYHIPYNLHQPPISQGNYCYNDKSSHILRAKFSHFFFTRQQMILSFCPTNRVIDSNCNSLKQLGQLHKFLKIFSSC